jgi:hypothetical protein
MSKNDFLDNEAKYLEFAWTIMESITNLKKLLLTNTKHCQQLEKNQFHNYELL